MSSLEAIYAPSSTTITTSVGISDTGMAAPTDAVSAGLLQEIHQRHVVIEHLKARLAAQGHQPDIDPRQAGTSSMMTSAFYQSQLPASQDDNAFQAAPINVLSALSLVPPAQTTSHATPFQPSPLDQINSVFSAPVGPSTMPIPDSTVDDLDAFGLAQRSHHRTQPSPPSNTLYAPFSQATTSSSGHQPPSSMQASAPAPPTIANSFLAQLMGTSTSSLSRDVDLPDADVLDELQQVLMADHTLHAPASGSGDDQSSRSSTAHLEDPAYSLSPSGRPHIEPVCRSAPPPPTPPSESPARSRRSSKSRSTSRTRAGGKIRRAASHGSRTAERPTEDTLRNRRRRGYTEGALSNAAPDMAALQLMQDVQLGKLSRAQINDALSSGRLSSSQYPCTEHYCTKKVHGCPICAKEFPSHSKLQRHIVSHTGEKPFECEHCSTRFTQRCSLKTHQQRCSATASAPVLSRPRRSRPRSVDPQSTASSPWSIKPEPGDNNLVEEPETLPSAVLQGWLPASTPTQSEVSTMDHNMDQLQLDDMPMDADMDIGGDLMDA
eukprot:m.110564 g.110564  ORF g.110564 m.110564 type:complete len:549 (-) comp15370_c0_seq1:87-1733(-)